jgi:hypothetical protein
VVEHEASANAGEVAQRTSADSVTATLSVASFIVQLDASSSPRSRRSAVRQLRRRSSPLRRTVLSIATCTTSASLSTNSVATTFASPSPIVTRIAPSCSTSRCSKNSPFAGARSGTSNAPSFSSRDASEKLSVRAT